MSYPIIGISTQTADPAGNVILRLDPKTPAENYSARVKRYPLLSGGSKIVFTDTPNNPGDRTIQVSSRVDENKWNKIKTIYEQKKIICCSTAEGFYSAAISGVKMYNGLAEIKILVEDFI